MWPCCRAITAKRHDWRCASSPRPPRSREPRTCSTSRRPTSTDACTTARPGLDFARRLRDAGARVAVPTTLNVSSLDLLHPGLVRLDAATVPARELMDAYVSMGCRPTWTCAPYQLPQRARVRRTRRMGRVQRDRVRELGAGRANRPIRRLHRHLLRDHRTRTGGGPAPGRAPSRPRGLPRRGACTSACWPTRSRTPRSAHVVGRSDRHRPSRRSSACRRRP